MCGRRDGRRRGRSSKRRVEGVAGVVGGGVEGVAGVVGGIIGGVVDLVVSVFG